MPRLRVLPAVSFAALIYAILVLESCGSFIDPCKSASRSSSFQDLRISQQLLRYGTWPLVTVNGQSIPSSGLGFPLYTERFYSGSLRFLTEDWWGNNACDGLEDEVGQVIGTYDVHSPGAASAPQQAAGSYDASHTKGSVTFAAAKATQRATLAGYPGSRTITADVKIKKLGGLTFRLVFREKWP